MMPGCIAWGLLSRFQFSFPASTWRWTVLQLVVSGALAVLLPVFLLCPRLRKRLTSGLLAQLDASKGQCPKASSNNSSSNLALQGPGIAQERRAPSRAEQQDWGAVAQQLAVFLQPLLGEAAARQLIQDLATALAQQDAANEPGPDTYTGGTRLVPVGLKVDAPHSKLQTLGPPLLGHLSSTLEAGMAQDSPTPAHMFAGVAAVFSGCIQLLASVFEFLAPPQQAGGTAGSVDEGPLGPPLLGQHTTRFGGPDQAQQLLDGALQKLQAAGSSVYEAAACVQGHVAAARRAGSSSSSSHQAGVSPVTLVCLDPPCAAEGVAGALDIHLRHTTSSPSATNSSSSSSSSAAPNNTAGSTPTSSSRGSTGRLVVYTNHGLLLDVASVPLSDTIRCDLPALPTGVYQLALLPAAPPGDTPSAHSLAAACQPLVTYPLLVLPPVAAAELHQYWRGAVNAAAAGQGGPRAVIPAGQQGVLLGGGTGGQLPAPLAALHHVWGSQLSSMICDIAALMLSAAAAADPQQQPHQQQQQQEEEEEPEKQRQQQQQQQEGEPNQRQQQQGGEPELLQQQPPNSMGASLGSATFQPAAYAHLLHNLLLHLCRHRLWELVALVTTPGHPGVTAAAEAGQGIGPRLVPQPARHTSGSVAAAGGSRGAAGGACWGAVVAAGGSPAKRRGAASSSSSMPVVGLSAERVPASQGGSSSSSRSGGAAAASHTPPPPPLGAAEELAACGTWGGRWRQLSRGFSNADFESRYLEYVYDTTLPADVANFPMVIMIALGSGILTDSFDTTKPWWQHVARLLFGVLFCAPYILLLVYRRRLRGGGRRERARCLADAMLALTGYVIILGRLYTLPTLARMLDNSWRSWAVLVVGQGLFTTCCRQTRTRALLPVAAYEWLGWGTASALAQGRLLPAALRYLCVAAAASVCSVVLEVRSRRCFCRQQLLAAWEAAAGGAAAAGGGAAGKGKGEEPDSKCHME